MKVLITGGSGLLGKQINKQAIHWDYPSSKRVDIINLSSIEKFLSENKYGEKDLIVHCAALTGLKRCEDMKHKARDVNVCGTENVVKAANRRGTFVIYISTDYVFLGKKGNYSENDKTNPSTYYGLTKCEGERFVLCYGTSTVIRTSFVPTGKWQHPAAFVDKFSSFVTVDVLVKGLIKIIEDEYRPLGLLHVAGNRKSFYELAKTLSPDVGKISFEDMKLNIPKDTSLDTERFRRIYGNLE